MTWFDPDIHPLILTGICLAVWLLGKLLIEPLPPEEHSDDGLPEDWPYRRKR